MQTPHSQEERLRQWARKYFVPVEQRFPNWHPIVLEEMALKDFDIPRTPLATATATDVACMTELSPGWPGACYVPLPPTETGYRRDARHETLRGPKFMAPIPEAILHTELYLG